MSALPLIEAVQRAGGAIALQGDRLRLSAPEPLPENLVQELRLHKMELIDHLQHARQSGLGEPPAAVPAAAAALSNGTIAAWTDGVARLRAIARPRTYPEHAWQQLIIDAERFLHRWAQQAAAFGWPDWEIFGCHRRESWHRLDGMGLVLALMGRQLAALTGTEAVIRTAGGARQTYRRKPRDPLHPAERCLVWEVS
jgi:hypothetical protein